MTVQQSTRALRVLRLNITKEQLIQAIKQGIPIIIRANYKQIYQDMVDAGWTSENFNTLSGNSNTFSVKIKQYFTWTTAEQYQYSDDYIETFPLVYTQNDENYVYITFIMDEEFKHTNDISDLLIIELISDDEPST